MFAKHIIQYTKKILERFQIVIWKQQGTPYIAGPKLEGVPCFEWAHLQMNIYKCEE